MGQQQQQGGSFPERPLPTGAPKIAAPSPTELPSTKLQQTSAQRAYVTENFPAQCGPMPVDALTARIQEWKSDFWTCRSGLLSTEVSDGSERLYDSDDQSSQQDSGESLYRFGRF